MYRHLLVPALALLPWASSGGWAVITLDALPDYVEVGKPTELRFVVRQHGEDPIRNLNPTVVLSRKGEDTRVAAAPTANGSYRVRFTVATAGVWTISIKSGFGRSDVELAPIAAIAAGTPAPRLPEQARGQRLFIAKGCLTCHEHAEVERSGTVGAGPVLTGQRFNAAYLKQFLADPSIKPRTRDLRMPDLQLSEQEIDALVAFINGSLRAAR